MKLRSFFYLLATIVTGLLLAGTIAFFWLFAQSPLGLFNGSRAQPSAAMFVSKQAPVMASLMANPDRLTSLRQVIVNPSDRRQSRTELDQFKQGIAGLWGLDYRLDLQPWLGDEVTVAVTTLDIDRDRENGQQPGYLMAVNTHDSQRSREFLQVFWQKRAIAGADLIFESYKGTQLIYGRELHDRSKSGVAESNYESVGGDLSGTPPKSPILGDFENLRVPQNGGFRGQIHTVVQQRPKSSSRSPQNADQTRPERSFASAVVGNQFVLFANSPKVLRDAINTVQAAELGLADSENYQTAIAHLNQGRVGMVFLNLPQLAALTGEESALADELAIKSEQNSATYESLAIALGLDRQGLTAETALLIPGEIASTPAASKPIGALQYIPAASPFSASGVNLNQSWSSLSQGVSGYQRAAELINRPIDALRDRWKLDLPQDIFSWVKGDYALALVPQPDERVNNKAALPRLGDWVFAADKSADQNAQSAIAHLDEIARAQGISIGSLQLSDQTINVWTRLSTAGDAKKSEQKDLEVQAEVAGVHASVGNYEIFTTSIEAMSGVLKATQNPISKGKTFKQAIAHLATPNNGYLYLDWETAQPLLESRFPILKVLELAGQPFFDHLRSITLSGYGGQSGVQRSGAFIKLED